MHAPSSPTTHQWLFCQPFPSALECGACLPPLGHGFFAMDILASRISQTLNLSPSTEASVESSLRPGARAAHTVCARTARAFVRVCGCSAAVGDAA